MTDGGGTDDANGTAGETDDANDAGGETGGTVCPFCAVGCRLDCEGERSEPSKRERGVKRPVSRGGERSEPSDSERRLERTADREGERSAVSGNGRVVGRNGPANPDGRLCEQGLHAFDPLDDPDRLKRPLVRRDGDLEPVSWETALDRAVTGFERIIDDSGPDAMAFLGAPRCPTETNYLLGKLARTLGTNNVDNRARLCHAGAARVLESRLGWGATTNSLEDLRGADLFLVVGANPAARQPVAFDTAVRPAVNDGATLVHVDPHANETTRLADYHLAPRPGTDALLVSLLSALVVDLGGVDERFVAERTSGFEAFRESLDERDLPADAAGADVDPERVEAVANAVADAERVVVMTGTGGDDTATADALVNLCLATGNVGRAGTGFTILRGLANEQGAVDAGCVPDRLPGHQPVTDEAARERLADEWGHSVPTTPGKTEYELVTEFGEEVEAALVVGENPAVSKRDADELATGLDALDTLVVSELTPSETTAHADVVFPAAAGVERAGTVTNLDRQVQRLRPLAEPPGGARTDFEILSELGRRLVGEGFDFEGPREGFAELRTVAPPYAGLSYDGLADESRRWPAFGRDGSGGGGGDPFLFADGFDTPDGRAAFVPADLSGLTERADAGDDGGLRLVVGDRAGGFGTGDDRVDRSLTVHPADAQVRDVADGDRVLVTSGATTVETTAAVSEAVRRGAVHLHASVADPLVRSGTGGRTVRLDSVEESE